LASGILCIFVFSTEPSQESIIREFSRLVANSRVGLVDGFFIILEEQVVFVVMFVNLAGFVEIIHLFGLLNSFLHEVLVVCHCIHDIVPHLIWTLGLFYPAGHF